MDRTYERYRIERRRVPNVVHHPHPFRVKIRRWALLKLILKELIEYKGNVKVAKNNPCAYGVFSGPIGGFAPRERLCVGCLRCTTQYPEVSTILHNQKRSVFGDCYVTPEQVDMIMYEAERGNLSVKGAGFRGKFGGKEWDCIWTDMSEIVRPTRDGIYGREFISTAITLGERPSFLNFDHKLQPTGALPRSVEIPFPIIFDTLPNATFTHPQIAPILAEAACQLHTYTLLPFTLMKKYNLRGEHIIPSITAQQWASFKTWKVKPKILELTKWDSDVIPEILSQYPHVFLILRANFEDDLLSYYHAGIRLFHLTASEHGRGKRGKFIVDLIREAHLSFVTSNCRDHVTLIGSGGIVAAEHVPKSMLLGLDAVAVSTPLLIALQGKLSGKDAFYIPKRVSLGWGVQRIKNLMGAWQDQLFEFAGAMGLRELQRMRGEIGRAIFQHDLEKEAFFGIQGYDV